MQIISKLKFQGATRPKLTGVWSLRAQFGGFAPYLLSPPKNSFCAPFTITPFSNFQFSHMFNFLQFSLLFTFQKNHFFMFFHFFHFPLFFYLFHFFHHFVFFYFFHFFTFFIFFGTLEVPERGLGGFWYGGCPKVFSRKLHINFQVSTFLGRAPFCISPERHHGV